MKTILVVFLFSITLFSQTNKQLSEKAEISILTCAPGQKELYSYFGHSAMRVKDPINNIDKVYNYGMFDFNTPNFYLKFCQGKLLYQVNSYDFKYFPYIYHKENRWIKSQKLNLNPSQNQKLFDYLEWNVLPENKKYHYDFFYDNCATKIHEVIEKSIGKISFNYTKFPKDFTHRDLIHTYIPENSWAKFGIDLALGAVIDKKATFKQYLFLPDYINLGIINSSLNQQKLVSKSSYILPDFHLKKPVTNFFLSPLFISILLLLITLYLTLISKHTAWYKGISVIYGVLGLVIFCLWFLTEHSTTKMNMNLLWANPLLIIYPFVREKSKLILTYLLSISLILFVLITVIQYQKFNTCFFILAGCLVPIVMKRYQLN